VEPNTSELFLRSGDRLHLVCQQRVTSTAKDVVWSKAETRGPVSINVADDDLRYQTIDSSKPNAPYTVSQRPADEGGDLLHSELVKNDVARADTGYYRCRLGLGSESSRMLVTVIDSTSLSLLVISVDRLHRSLPSFICPRD